MTENAPTRLRRKTWEHNPSMVKPSVYRVVIPRDNLDRQELNEWCRDNRLTIADCYMKTDMYSHHFAFDDLIIATHFKLRWS